MKLSTCFVVAALAFSATAHAQTSQTYRFGEGQSTLQPSHAQPAPGAQPHDAAPPAQGADHAPAKAKPKHKARRRTHYRRRVTQPDTYSHN